MMGHEYCWTGGMWIFPVIGIVVMLTVLYFIFGQRNLRPQCHGSGQYPDMPKEMLSALDILKKRYAKGEITKEEFEQMKQDIM